jgi:hypothetical protein
MKDKEFKFEDIEAPHTLGGASYILFRYIGSWAGGRDDEDDSLPNAQKKKTLNSPH